MECQAPVAGQAHQGAVVVVTSLPAEADRDACPGGTQSQLHVLTASERGSCYCIDTQRGLPEKMTSQTSTAKSTHSVPSLSVSTAGREVQTVLEVR